MGTLGRLRSAVVLSAPLLLLCMQLLPAMALPPRQKILSDGLKAAKYWHITTAKSQLPCNWKQSTLMLGVMTLYRATNDTSLRDWAHNFANANNWKLCPEGAGAIVPDNQICAATYLELYATAPQQQRDASWLKDVRRQFDEELAAGSVKNWSWVDALFMSISVWARMGTLTGQKAYFDHMWKNFEYCVVSPTGYAFWSPSDNLYYRDPPRGSPDGVFWARGNGWALAALATAADLTPKSDPHKAVYEEFVSKHAARLRELQGDDGCWRASLTDPAFNPLPETTGTSMFVYGIAWGVKAGVLDANTYMPTLEAAWRCLSTTSLQPSGRLGYCQPEGVGPRRNFDANSTNAFGVGQFLMAASALSKLAPAA